MAIPADVFLWQQEGAEGVPTTWRISAANGGRTDVEIMNDTQAIISLGLDRPYESKEAALAALAAYNLTPSEIIPPG